MKSLDLKSGVDYDTRFKLLIKYLMLKITKKFSKGLY